MKRISVLIGTAFILLVFGAQGLLAQNTALTIRDCIQYALKNNAQLKNAERQVRIAGTNVTSSRSSILPQVSASFSSRRIYQAEQGPFLQEVPIRDPETGQVVLIQKVIFMESYYRNSYNNGISLMQNIYDGGRWWNRIKQANATYRSAEYNYKATREEIIALVAQRYYELLKSIRLQEVYEKAVESAREQLKKTESLYEVGSVARVDVFRARVTAGQEEINLIKQKNTVRLNENNLKLALGMEPTRPIKIIPDELNLEPLNMPLQEVFKLAEQKNPGLRSLEETVVADNLGIKVAKGGFLPQISLRLNYGRFNTLLERLYRPFDKNYQVSGTVSVSWNLFNGFSDMAAVERQSLSYYIDKENLINRRLSLRNDIEQAYLNLQAYEEIERINQDNLQAAEEDLRLSEERYRVGSGTLLDVINARVGLTRARATLVTNKYDRLIALAVLYSKIGILEEKIKSILE